MHSITHSPWNLVVNLGIKCNLLRVSRTAKIRYISSPFDNIDTVEGLRSTATLLATEFEGHMNSPEDWQCRNVWTRESPPTIRAKSITKKDMPEVEYPHFHADWSQGTLSEEDVKAWMNDPQTDHTIVWPYLRENFQRRQKRLISILRNKKSVLFLRLDTNMHGKRIFAHNQASDLQFFIATVRAAYPATPIGLLYFYYDYPDYPRRFPPSDDYLAVPLPRGDEPEIFDFVASWVKRLTLLPRSQLGVDPEP